MCAQVCSHVHLIFIYRYRAQQKSNSEPPPLHAPYEFSFSNGRAQRFRPYPVSDASLRLAPHGPSFRRASFGAMFTSVLTIVYLFYKVITMSTLLFASLNQTVNSRIQANNTGISAHQIMGRQPVLNLILSAAIRDDGGLETHRSSWRLCKQDFTIHTGCQLF